MIAYASRTGTRRNLRALRKAGWRLLVTPVMPRTEGFKNYALDNGAWSAHIIEKPWDAAAFERMLMALGCNADWVVAPDIVAGGYESLSLSMSWLDRCKQRCPAVLIAVQDGIKTADLDGIVDERTGIFLGGTTEYKLSTMREWGSWCADRSVWFHVGRVNTVRRINLCLSAGATSFDGTSASRYAVTLPKLDAARRQRTMFELEGW